VRRRFTPLKAHEQPGQQTRAFPVP
jgi:hypothetical protein